MLGMAAQHLPVVLLFGIDERERACSMGDKEGGRLLRAP